MYRIKKKILVVFFLFFFSERYCNFFGKEVYFSSIFNKINLPLIACSKSP